MEGNAADNDHRQPGVADHPVITQIILVGGHKLHVPVDLGVRRIVLPALDGKLDDGRFEARAFITRAVPAHLSQRSSERVPFRDQEFALAGFDALDGRVKDRLEDDRFPCGSREPEMGLDILQAHTCQLTG